MIAWSTGTYRESSQQLLVLRKSLLTPELRVELQPKERQLLQKRAKVLRRQRLLLLRRDQMLLN
jgi:hypothetical protein